MRRLLVICGPTASGKTALAVELAERLGAEIVSADSQQCYRGLDAGTAKPTREEQARARHHLLDVADPEEQLDAARFVQLAAPGASPAFRAALREELERVGVPALHERLRKVDPAAAARILPNDRVRI